MVGALLIVLIFGIRVFHFSNLVSDQPYLECSDNESLWVSDDTPA